jgi:streptogramin lyase
MYESTRVATYAIVASLLVSGTAAAFQVNGTVKTAGKPLAAAMVTVTAANSKMGAETVTVFTGPDGKYATPDLGSALTEDDIQDIAAKKVGFTAKDPDRKSLGKAGIQADFAMEPTDNVAHQVSPAAWLDSLSLPDDPIRQRAMIDCGDCHAIPSKEIRNMGATLSGMPQPLRIAGWDQVISKMSDIEEGALNGHQFKSNELYITPNDKKVLASFLSAHLTRDYSTFPLAEWEKCCAGAPTAAVGTVIKEYNLPVDSTSQPREVVTVKGSPYIWGTDIPLNRLFRLDPKDGSLKWLRVPGDSPHVHTLKPDSAGYIWATLLGEGRIGRFEPGSEQWKIFPPFQPKDNRPIIINDFATNYLREVQPDSMGRIWVNSTSHNVLGSLDPKTGEVKLHEESSLPVEPGRTPRTMASYSLVMASDKKHIWWSQLMGNFGSFNTETDKVEDVIRFPLGAGPRRMAIDENDVVWLPLYGAGQLYAYDTKKKVELGRYDLPDRSAGPYAVTWDHVRKVVWVGTMNSNRVYRFDPKSKQWTQYLMPRDGARFRVLPVDASGNVFGTYGTFPGNLDRSTKVMVMKPGEVN